MNLIFSVVQVAAVGFGCDRLEGMLKASAPLDAKDIGAKILEAVDEFKAGAPQLDGRTLIVIKAV